MCGLAGVVFKDHKRTEEQYGTIRGLYTDVLTRASVRGRHATGVATIERRGAYRLVKAPMEAEQFVEDDAYGTHLNKLNNKSSAIMGHTRYSTKGSKFRNRNNHPIVAGTVVGTHNGHIRNHNELFTKFGMNRFAEVDSEALFRLFATADSPDQYFNDRLPMVSGRVSAVFADYEYPEYVYIMKGNNPLEVYYDKEFKCIYYGSTDEILKPLIEARPVKKIKLEPMTMIRVNTKTLKLKRRKIEFKTLELKKINDSGAKKVIGKYANTVSGFVPRFSHSDALKKVSPTKTKKKSRKHPKMGFKRTVQQNFMSGLITVTCHKCGVTADVRTQEVFVRDMCRCNDA